MIRESYDIQVSNALPTASLANLVPLQCPLAVSRVQDGRQPDRCGQSPNNIPSSRPHSWLRSVSDAYPTGKLIRARLRTNEPWQPKGTFFECFITVCRQQLLGFGTGALYGRFFLTTSHYLMWSYYPFHDLFGKLLSKCFHQHRSQLVSLLHRFPVDPECLIQCAEGIRELLRFHQCQSAEGALRLWSSVSVRVRPP